MSLLILYFIRHFLFNLNRAFRVQGTLYLGIEDSKLSSVTVLVPAHNEEKVIEDALLALLKQDYPPHLFRIVPVNDRSTDQTKSIIDLMTQQYPNRIFPFHRTEGKPGKSAALKEICAQIETDLILIFDADYIPLEIVRKAAESAPTIS